MARPNRIYKDVPLFSVIIPTYNRSRFVTKAIDSVLRQTYRKFQVIVIDDGSTDDTKNVLKKYGNKITTIYQENAGVSAARNAGIRRTEGEWIAFLDSDDEWKQEYLSSQINRIRSYPEVVAHITNAVTIYPTGKTRSHFEPKLLKKIGGENYHIFDKPLCALLDHPHWYLQSTVIRRDILLRAGLFNTGLSIAEDLDLLTRVAMQGPFGISSEILVETYRRPESISNLGQQKESDGARVCEMFEFVYRNLAATTGLQRREKKTVARAMSANRRALGNQFLKQENSAEARSWYKKAFLSSPSLGSGTKYLLSFLPDRIAKIFILK